jgi:hypothetical protein
MVSSRELAGETGLEWNHRRGKQWATEEWQETSSCPTDSWDIENRITQAQLPAGTINAMTHYGDGRRREYVGCAALR